MALVVLLRGVNVGGHRRFHPAKLAQALKHLDAVNVGAAGTLVIRRPVRRAELRRAIERRLPFPMLTVICDGRDIVRLLEADHFVGHPIGPDQVRFVTVLARAPRAGPRPPLTFPESGTWLVKVVVRERQFIVGLYRRQMKTIGHLDRLDRVWGVRGTTRSWGTLASIAKLLRPPDAEIGRGTRSAP